MCSWICSWITILLENSKESTCQFCLGKMLSVVVLVVVGVLTLFYFIFNRSLSSISSSSSTQADREFDEKMKYYRSLLKLRNAHVSLLPPKMLTSLCGYDPLTPQSLQAFQNIKENTKCVFAKKSRLWGSDDQWNNANTFRAFTLFSSLQNGFDGFLIWVPSGGDKIETFSQQVNRVLSHFSTQNPKGHDCLKYRNSVGKRGWRYAFGEQEFFITTFAHCYNSNHSRYAFGNLEEQEEEEEQEQKNGGKEEEKEKEKKNGERGGGRGKDCFILFQPYHSFLFNDVGEDTPETNWEKPVTMRDRIRCEYKKAGQEYFIPEHVNSFPIARQIVPPLNYLHLARKEEAGEGDSVVKWWETELE
eukprot:Lithocolla_globosa_v1_NODE_3316_length_1702_cov_21.956891.p1 type:complete len:360 gc:universal NODE_3316_length_1702_cov_21.956891:1623-544(-)